jgi:lipopolysaccharide transport system permease protein
MSTQLVRDIWKRRSLIMAFALSDLRVKYKNSVLGFFWSFLEPLLMLAVFYFAFTTFLKNSIPNYPLFLLLGLVIWGMYNRGTSMGLVSLLGKAGLISKTAVPREIPVISSSITSFFMMCFEFAAFFVFEAAFRFTPPITMLFIPLLLFILFVYTLGISFALSVLAVRFRDLQSIWGVLLQATFFTSPIVYTMKVFPSSILPIISLNPLVIIIEMTHDAGLYGLVPQINLILEAIGSSFLTLAIGYTIFKIFNKRIIEEL